MHLAIASRADPSLPLARLRGRGELSELRAADLRFTVNEAATYLNQVMGLDLSAEEVAALENRTEGWIVGLQMAALSLQGREDSANFVRAFTGSHHFVIDYPLEEVLQRQPERVRQFLVQTAILDRLNGPLCDAVTGQEDGRGMLESLERGNLFVVSLDDEREWYRYHHLFADVLQARLIEEQPNQIPDLHRRASEWYEQSDLPSYAIRHALAADDFERAADLIEFAWPAMNRSRQEATLLGWLKALPDELVRTRPVLSVGYAYALLESGELEAAEARLQDAERWLDTPAVMGKQVKMVVVDEEQFRSLPARIAVYRAAHSQALGDVAGTVKYARRALDLTPEGDHIGRGAAGALLGLASWATGDLEAATRHLQTSKELGKRAGLPENRYRWCVSMARINEAQGDLDSALDLLHEAERLYFVGFTPNVRPMAALKTRIWVGQGRLAEALAWAQEQELSVEDDLSYLREFEHITLARLLIAQHRSEREERPIHEAMELLKRLLKAAEEGGRTGSVIEILVLHALAHQAQGDIPSALVPLERALALAEPEGYVRIFVDEGPPMAELLREAAKHGTAPNYSGQLLTAFGKAEGTTPVAQLLIEPLSERELEVLRLLATELTGPEIAGELMVSLNTMRTHTKNIYSKLGVNNRRAAVRRAEELDLL